MSGNTGETHAWNPHKADKDVEVGDYHFKRKNYRAAESRYREALHFQDNNAAAMYGLAETLEKENKRDEAVQFYTKYLKTVPGGENAPDARKALERLKAPLPQVSQNDLPAAPQPPQTTAAEKKNLKQRVKDQFGSEWCVNVAGQHCTHSKPSDKPDPAPPESKN